MMRRLFFMTALILATATMTWGLVAWADSGFTTQPLWPMDRALQLHPVHLIVVGLALLPASLSALLSDAHPSDSIGKPESHEEPS
jgi:hypothetical protein